MPDNECPGCDGSGECVECNGGDEELMPCDQCDDTGDCPECDGLGTLEEN